MTSVSVDRLPGIVIPSEPDTYDTSEVTSLMLAAYHGDIGNVLTLLKENEHCVMSRNVFGQTALHYAIDNGQINVIDVLVAYEADLHELDSHGQNILHRCVQYGSMPKVETCLTVGINIDICDSNGDTALTIAAQRGYLNIVKLLVNGGSDISIRNNAGLNATDCAFCNNQKEVQEFLLNSKSRPIDDTLKEIMIQTCNCGSIETVRSLVDANGEAIVNFREECFSYVSPFHLACRNGHLALAQLLKQNKANIHSRNQTLNTPLISSVFNNQLHIVEWLIATGVRMNDRNIFNGCALHTAVFQGYMPIVKLLVENGIMLNFHKTNCFTAVHIAVQEEHLDILDYLLEKGALPDVKIEGGVTPLLKAVASKNVAMVECLIKYGACVNKYDHDFNTPILVAVTENSLDMVKYLIEKGADVNITQENGYSPRDAACSLGYFDIVSYLTNVKPSNVHLDAIFQKNIPDAQESLFKMCQTGKGTRHQFDQFIRAEANVNGIDSAGRTPLIVATQNCSKQCVQWLLEKSVRVFTRDQESFTAIQYAVENKDIDILGLLLQNVSHNNINKEQTQHVLESAIKHCIKSNSYVSVCITNILLKHCFFRGLKGNCTPKLLKECITFESLAIAKLLFNHQLRFDSFEPILVILYCMNSHLGMLQCLVQYISDSRHCLFYVKLAVRFCLANQLKQALCTVTQKLFNGEEIFWSNNQNFWCGSESSAFKNTMELVVDKGLDIDAQNISGCTFLMFAASMGMVEEVKYILQKGGDISMVNKAGKDALDMALDAGQYEIAMLLTDGPSRISGILNAHIDVMYQIKS